jgi:hypothetical protein
MAWATFGAAAVGFLVPNPFPTIAADSTPDENEITILQRFVEFVGNTRPKM